MRRTIADGDPRAIAEELNRIDRFLVKVLMIHFRCDQVHEHEDLWFTILQA